MVISFIGHSFVSPQGKVKETVKEQILNIIDGSKITFYLGGYGDFDSLCASVCRELKQDCKDLEMVYVTPYMTLSEQVKVKELLRFGFYDTSIYPPIETVPPRFAILKRNEWMMQNSDIIIAYVKHNYGGAYQALKIAKRKNKKIINVCDFII